MTTQVAADLRAAAEVLRRDGWTQDVFHRRADEGRICHCAEGAIQVAVGRHINVRPDDGCEAGADWDENYDPPVERRYEAAEAALCDFVHVDAIPRWNDTDRRTADEVIAALEAAADAAEAPDCTHITSCEIGDHTYSWPCDYAPGSGKFAADVAEQQTTGVGGRRSGLPGDVEPPADRDRHHGQD